MKTIKNAFLSDRVFPYYTGLLLRHIAENGDIVADVPEWYRFIFKDANDNTCENILMRKYGRMLIDEDLLIGYDSQYRAFLQYINESMLRYYDLFTTHINPYHNVDEHKEIRNEYGEHVTKNKYGQHETDVELAERVSTNEIGNDTITETIKRTGQNPAEFKNAQQTTNSNVGRIDTTTQNVGGIKDTTTSKEHDDTTTSQLHVDTITEDRGGNIGVTSNKTLAFEHIDYASMMKLYDFFIGEWLNYFALGVWGC